MQFKDFCTGYQKIQPQANNYLTLHLHCLIYITPSNLGNQFINFLSILSQIYNKPYLPLIEIFTHRHTQIVYFCKKKSMRYINVVANSKLLY